VFRVKASLNETYSRVIFDFIRGKLPVKPIGVSELHSFEPLNQFGWMRGNEVRHLTLKSLSPIEAAREVCGGWFFGG
jgi:hypothetical protein